VRRLAPALLLAAAAALAQDAASLRSADPYERARAFQLGAASGDREWAARARSALREDESPLVQCRALQVLGKLRDRPSMAAIAAKLDSPYRSVRAFAAWALGELSDAEAAPILAPLVRLDQDVDVLGFAIEALSKVGAQSSQARVAAMLAHPDARIRDAAAQTLAVIGDEASTGALFAQLDRETDLAVQRSIVKAVGKIGGEYAARQLAHLLGNGASPLRQRMAAEAFIEMGTAGALALGEVLEETDDPSVQALAARTLGEIGAGAPTSKLVELLDAKDPRPRLAAVAALGKIGGPTALAALSSLAKHGDGWSRELAAESAKRLTAELAAAR
jgi:HEAT repeat protein